MKMDLGKGQALDGNIGNRIKKAAVNLPNGAIYEGEWLGEMRDGWGV